jgi:hypothetical protein
VSAKEARRLALKEFGLSGRSTNDIPCKVDFGFMQTKAFLDQNIVLDPGRHGVSRRLICPSCQHVA